MFRAHLCCRCWYGRHLRHASIHVFKEAAVILIVRCTPDRSTALNITAVHFAEHIMSSLYSLWGRWADKHHHFHRRLTTCFSGPSSTGTSADIQLIHNYHLTWPFIWSSRVSGPLPAKLITVGRGTRGRLRHAIEFMKAPIINFTLHREAFDYRLTLFFSDSFIETNGDAYWIQHINLWSNRVIIGRCRPPCSARY